MRTWRVWWNDETGRNHIVKVDATGIVPAIDEAQRKAMDKYGLEYLGWDLWKVEMV